MAMAQAMVDMATDMAMEVAMDMVMVTKKRGGRKERKERNSTIINHPRRLQKIRIKNHVLLFQKENIAS